MTSHLNSHGTNDIKPEMLSGVQTGNGTPHDKYNIRGIARAHKQKRRHFNAKTTSAKLYIYIVVGQGTAIRLTESHFCWICLSLFLDILWVLLLVYDDPSRKSQTTKIDLSYLHFSGIYIKTSITREPILLYLFSGIISSLGSRLYCL